MLEVYPLLSVLQHNEQRQKKPTLFSSQVSCSVFHLEDHLKVAMLLSCSSSDFPKPSRLFLLWGPKAFRYAVVRCNFDSCCLWQLADIICLLQYRLENKKKKRKRNTHMYQADFKCGKSTRGLTTFVKRRKPTSDSRCIVAAKHMMCVHWFSCRFLPIKVDFHECPRVRQRTLHR